MDDAATLRTALRTALRVMNEQYMVMASALRRDGITRRPDGVWQAATDHFETGPAIDPAADPRVEVAEDLRQARSEVRRALRGAGPPPGPLP